MHQLITVPFRGDTLFAVHQPDGIFIAIKPIADRLGLDWSGQRQQLERSPVLKRGRAVIPLPTPGGQQDTVCLRLDLINGWLFGVDASRVNRIERVEGRFEKRADALGREVEKIQDRTLSRSEALTHNDAQDRIVGILRGEVDEHVRAFNDRQQRRIDALEAVPRK